MTNKQVQEILDRANAATQGPWEDGVTWAGTHARIRAGGLWLLTIAPECEGAFPCFRNVSDAVFIAHARADVPDLCRDLLAARESIDTMLARITELEAVRDRLAEVVRMFLAPES